MNRTQLIHLARRVLSLPTAPYHEEQVAAAIRRECARLGLRARTDRFGNLHVRYRRGPAHRSPLVFVAHMDHPGFEVLENSRNGTVRAEFLGLVPREWVVGAPVRLFGAREARGRVARIDSWEQRHLVRLKVDGPARRGDPGMWDLKPLMVRGDRLVSRGCDDLIGCLSLLAALQELTRRRVAGDVIFLFTRAEEVGFHGALAVARSGLLPREARVVSVETSRELPPRARRGGGPIVRVGDWASVFDGELTRFLFEVASERQRADRDFRFQRCLMDGGTCEATAFGQYGYRAGALCVALGNYHNLGPRRRVAEEYVSVGDVAGLVQLIVACVQAAPRFSQYTSRLRGRLDRLLRTAPRRLSPTFNLLS